MVKKNIFEARNPFSNLNSEKTKKFVKQFEDDEIIKEEALKVEGAKLQYIDKELMKKIDFNDREFINREISFDQLLEKDSLHNLADSINDIGLINPVYLIEKEEGKYKILSGFRRLSSIYYGYEKIDGFDIKKTNNLIIMPKNTSYDILDKISLHENTLREDLTILEISMKIWRESRKQKKRSDRIAKEYGISERTVARYLRVEKYPKELLSKLDKINNIRKADAVYNYIREKSIVDDNFDIDKELNKIIKLEISDIEKEIRKLKNKTIDESKLKIEKKDNKIIFEISENLTEAQIKKIKEIIFKQI